MVFVFSGLAEGFLLKGTRNRFLCAGEQYNNRASCAPAAETKLDCLCFLSSEGYILCRDLSVMYSI